MEKFLEDSRCGLRRRNAEKEERCNEYYISRKGLKELCKDQWKLFAYLHEYKGDIIDLLNKYKECLDHVSLLYHPIDFKKMVIKKYLDQVKPICLKPDDETSTSINEYLENDYEEECIFCIVDAVCKTELDVYDIAIWIYDNYGEDWLPRLFEGRKLSDEIIERLKLKFF